MRGHGHQCADHVRAAERCFAGGHAVEDAAEAEQVAAAIEAQALALLRRHVRRSADDRALLRELVFLPDRPRQAEIQDLHPALLALQPDVGRLDVPMDQAVFMGGRQSLGHFPADAQHLRQRQLPFAFQPILQAFAFEKLHGQEGDAAILADLVDGHDMIVFECRRRPRLAQETLLGRVAGGQAGQHRLEGDETLQLGIFGTEDDTHASRPQHLENAVGT